MLKNSDKGRIDHQDAFWKGGKNGFIVAVVSSAVIIQILFLGTLSYLYGSLYKDSTRVSAINTLMVNYDGGAIGQSMREAATYCTSPKFPSIVETPASKFTQQDVYDAVCRADDWGAVHTTAGASQRLLTALEESATAAQYNASDAILYVYNEARHPIVVEGYVVSNLQTLITTARIVYSTVNGLYALHTVDATSASARAALFNPISSSPVNIKPTG